MKYGSGKPPVKKDDALVVPMQIVDFLGLMMVDICTVLSANFEKTQQSFFQFFALFCILSVLTIGAECLLYYALKRQVVAAPVKSINI